MMSETEQNQSSTTPPAKLSLFSLTRQPPETPGMVTPPLHTSISVPFLWEEVPGKPRPAGIVDQLNLKPKSARSLDLPPRLFADAKVANFESPAIAGRDLSFRFPDSWAETAELAEMAAEDKGGKYVGYRRWMSFRKTKKIPTSGSEILISAGGGADDGGTRVKITRFRSRRSFFGRFNSNSHLIASIYGSLKQVIHPCKRKQDEMKKVS